MRFLAAAWDGPWHPVTQTQTTAADSSKVTGLFLPRTETVKGQGQSNTPVDTFPPCLTSVCWIHTLNWGWLNLQNSGDQRVGLLSLIAIRVLSKHRSRSEVFIYHLWIPAVGTTWEVKWKETGTAGGEIGGVNKQTHGCFTPTCSSDNSSKTLICSGRERGLL